MFSQFCGLYLSNYQSTNFMKKRILLIPTFIILVGVTLLATDRVDAFGFGADEDTLIQRLAKRLGKDEQEVQVVFDEVRQERQQQLQARYEERLNEEVAAGTITEDQKRLILAKHQEIQKIHQDMWEDIKEMSPEDRRATMQAQHDEMTAWAEENGIDLEALHFGPSEFGGRMGGRGMHGAMRGEISGEISDEFSGEMPRMHDWYDQE